MGAEESNVFIPAVHQAEGLLAARLRIPVDQAAMILRIRATSDGIPLPRVADAVLASHTRQGAPDIAGLF